MIACKQLNLVLDRAWIVFRLDDVMLTVTTPQRTFDREILVLWIKMFNSFRLVGRLRQTLFDCCNYEVLYKY
jgi:hypothetical protein